MSANRTIYVTPVDSEGKVRCYTHELEAARKVSQKATSLNREFYCCSKELADPDRCEFFLWVDDLIAGSSQLSVHSQESSIEETSNTMDRKRTLSSDNSSPIPKRLKPHSLSPSSQQTPPTSSTSSRLSHGKTRIPSSPASSALRLSQIKSALAETSDSNIQKASSRNSPPSTPSSNQDGSFKNSSPPATPSTPGWDKRMADILRGITFGDSASRTHDPDDVFSSSTRVKSTDFFLPPVAACTSSVEQDERSSSGLLTPPKTSHRSKGSELTANNHFETPTKNKGKAKANDSCHESIELPSSRADATRSHIRGAAAYPEQVLSAESFTEVVQKLQSLQSYVKKLERQKIALEKSNDAKAQKIAHLEQKIQELQPKVVT